MVRYVGNPVGFVPHGELQRTGIPVKDMVEVPHRVLPLAVVCKGNGGGGDGGAVPCILEIPVERFKERLVGEAGAYVHVSRQKHREAGCNGVYHCKVKEHAVFLGLVSPVIKMGVEDKEFPSPVASQFHPLGASYVL